MTPNRSQIRMLVTTAAALATVGVASLGITFWKDISSSSAAPASSAPAVTAPAMVPQTTAAPTTTSTVAPTIAPPGASPNERTPTLVLCVNDAFVASKPAFDGRGEGVKPQLRSPTQAQREAQQAGSVDPGCLEFDETLFQAAFRDDSSACRYKAQAADLINITQADQYGIQQPKACP